MRDQLIFSDLKKGINDILSRWRRQRWHWSIYCHQTPRSDELLQTSSYLSRYTSDELEISSTASFQFQWLFFKSKTSCVYKFLGTYSFGSSKVPHVLRHTVIWDLVTIANGFTSRNLDDCSPPVGCGRVLFNPVPSAIAWVFFYSIQPLNAKKALLINQHETNWCALRAHISLEFSFAVPLSDNPLGIATILTKIEARITTLRLVLKASFRRRTFHVPNRMQ